MIARVGDSRQPNRSDAVRQRFTRFGSNGNPEIIRRITEGFKGLIWGRVLGFPKNRKFAAQESLEGFPLLFFRNLV